MNKNEKEIEIKVKVKNVDKLITFLKKNGKFDKEKHQIDEYFIPAHRDFTNIRPINEWLRLRTEDGEYSLNYKNWHREADGKSHFCDEYESAVEHLDQVKKIFEAVNMKSIVTVDKRRKVWNYKNYEVSIDSVKELGDFVELEYKNHEDSRQPELITEEMTTFLETVGCTDIEKNYQGYPFLLMFGDEAKFEKQKEKEQIL